MSQMFDQKKFQQIIQNATKHYNDRRRLNQTLSIGIGLLGILLGLGATIAGVLVKDDARIAAILGAGSATTQAVLFAYPVEKRSAVYRILAARNKNLQDALEVRQATDEELITMLREFQSIQLEAAIEEAPVSRKEMEESAETESTLDDRTSVASPT